MRSAVRGQGDAPPDFSIVIPCRNGEATLGEQLEAVLGQTSGATFEVVVSDNGSTDGTRSLVESFSARDPRVRRVDSRERPGINVSRNAGVRAARGRFILLCDADDVVQPGWLEAHRSAVARGAVCVGGGVDRVLPNGQVLTRDRDLMSLETCDLRSPMGANCGFTAAVFHALGGFDESFAGGFDEVDFFWRAQQQGYPVTLVPEAIVSYRLRARPREVFKQYFAYGRGEVRLYTKHRTHGMTRPRAIRSSARILLALVRLAAHRGRRRRRSNIELLAYLLGHIRESIATRTLYV